MKIRTWLNSATKQLIETGIESARLDSSLILEAVLEKPREWVISHDDEELTDKQIETLNNNLLQRKKYTPLAYIIGSKEFYGRNFLVTKEVLIPRPESEAMIELLAKAVNSGQWLVSSTAEKLNTVHSSPFTILDIGTGSGILAITAQLELLNTIVVATDISRNALSVAKQNAARLESPVQFYEANLLDIPAAIKPDVVLANLPYVPNDLITSEEITKEPSLALFSGIDGLDHYRIFWGQVNSLPYKPQIIITESLENQHKDLTKIAQKAGYRLQKTEVLAQLFVRNI